MFSKIFSHGILGINARNLLYVKPFNPKKATALADSKLQTKAYLATRGIPAAKIYARIENRRQLQQFDFSQLPDECVLKPNQGFGGEGIMVFKGRKDDMFLIQGKTAISDTELSAHIEDILDGKFSLGGRHDTAFFEQILFPHECFARFRPVGLPDIRVIVFNLVPVMAMLRIPTKESEGKANVHLGGIGIGIDIAKGTTTHAAQYHGLLKELPHGGSPSGIKIPYWDEILLTCSRIQSITNIGYLAVDMTIDQNIGPAVLEVNARAGLMVQLANLAPLRARLERVKGLKVSSPEKGARLGQEIFGEKVKKLHTAKETAENQRPVLGTHETIIIVGSGESIEVPTLISPGKERSIFDPQLIAQLREKGAAEPQDHTEQTFRVKFTLGGKKIQTLVYAKEIPNKDVQAIIGKRDLGDFLIDPSKEKSAQKTSRMSAVKSDLRAVDNTLAQFDRDLLIIKYLKPINLEEERQRLSEDRRYNPTFLYPEIDIDINEAQKRLQKTIEDDSALGILLEKKRQKLLERIAMLQARGNAEEFLMASKKLYGSLSSSILRAAEAALHHRQACDLLPPQKELLSPQSVKTLFEEVLERYGLYNWQVSVRARLVADCTVGGQHIYIREGARFEKQHVQALIAHEIETHVLTAENGDHQPYALLRRGCANYLDTQEGLAIYNQNGVLSPHHERRFNPPRNVLGLAFGLEHSFAETRAYLEEELGYTADKAVTQTISIKRGLGDTSQGGGFTKSLVYFRGLRAIERFVEKGGDLKRLYVGKIALEDLDLVESLTDLQPPLLIPEHLREER
ncbi:MAG: tyrosine/phenylalanine carboxypeptidase domain-containing protein [Candidatus Peribacteraceae bacterium]